MDLDKCAPERVAVHFKMDRRLVERAEACARAEGLSRVEWMRAALASAALRSERHRRSIS